MGSTAHDRLFKRRINELEADIKRITRELEKLKSMTKTYSRSRKHIERAQVRESELQEVLDDLTMDQFEDLQFDSDMRYDLEKDSNSNKNGMTCRSEKCNSKNLRSIEVGPRRVMVCDDCGGRFTLHPKGVGLAKTG